MMYTQEEIAKYDAVVPFILNMHLGAFHVERKITGFIFLTSDYGNILSIITSEYGSAGVRLFNQMLKGHYHQEGTVLSLDNCYSLFQADIREGNL